MFEKKFIEVQQKNFSPAKRQIKRAENFKLRKLRKPSYQKR